MHGHASLNAGLDKQRLQIEIAFANLAQHWVERRHHRRNHDAVDSRRLQARHGKQIAEQHTILIHGAPLYRRHTPVGEQPLVSRPLLGFAARMRLRSAREHTQHRIRVADVEYQKHIVASHLPHGAAQNRA